MINKTDFTKLDDESIGKKEETFTKIFKQIVDGVLKHFGKVENHFDQKLWDLMIDQFHWWHKQQWVWKKIWIERNYHPKYHYVNPNWNDRSKWKDGQLLYIRQAPVETMLKSEEKEFWKRKEKRLKSMEQCKKDILEAKRKGKSININIGINTNN